jgi:DNA-binding SARP family transcriptional activator/tetratricopeptide (TPR) repeat protein
MRVMGEVPEIRLLGELEVIRGGRACALPASKKTRALLGYLAVTGRAHRREDLCDLLWQGPDDPRAALRWSLAKLRSVLGAAVVVADRERIALGEVEMDMQAVRRCAAGALSAASVEGLRAAVLRFRGEMLEGLGLPDCYRYHEWFTAERESARALRIALVSELERRCSPAPEEALRWARERVALDPLSEAAHIRVIALLAELGRKREAQAQFETCRRILAEETGEKPSAALLEARMSIAPLRSSPAVSASGGTSGDVNLSPASIPSAPIAHEETVTRPRLVGRERELLLLEAAMKGEDDPGKSAQGDRRVIALMGESGIGKSRLLAEVADRVRHAGGTVIAGRAFEAETVRPYGPFVDGLRAVPKERVPEALRPNLAALMPELEGFAAAADRPSQFEAVARLIAHLSSQGPFALLLDDLHWFDEASAGLLHYIARTPSASPVLVVCAARPGELSDNTAALRLVRGLSRDGRLMTLELAPLAPDATAALSLGVDPGADAERVVQESGGNPLLALELTRALARDAGTVWASIGGLIAERLARLDTGALELASWAAALGKSFDVQTLERVTGTSPVELLARTTELERHGVVRVSSDGAGYDFVHDLLRAGAYRRLSEPSRRLVHRHIARTLDREGAADSALAAEIAHHAALGGDSALAVRAALLAAQRCLRMFAYTEAARLAEVGLEHLSALPGEQRLPSELGLLEVLVYSGASANHPQRLEGELTRTVTEARNAGRHEVAAKGLQVLSILQFDGGDLAGARESTLRALEVATPDDALLRARQLGAAARCLGTLERDIEQARALQAEALALAGSAGVEIMEVECGEGILRAFMGDLEGAARSLERALALARSVEDRWCEYDCLRTLVQLELENGEPAPRSTELVAVASKMGEGGELPSARSLEALSRFVRAEEGAEESLERACEALRTVDAKGMLAYVLVFAAERDVDAGRLEASERRASEALRAATVVNRQSQMALARAVLSRAALAGGDERAAHRHVEAVRPAFDQVFALSARARSAMASAIAAVDALADRRAADEGPSAP